MNNTICFYDSGIGGLPYLKWLKNKLPHCRYAYVADTYNFPYGTKKTDELKIIIIKCIEKIITKINPGIIVIACNTASVTSLNILRERFCIPFVGVVPAVKPAALNSNAKRIGLFATNKTVSDSYTDMLISQFAKSCEIYRFADPGIVSFVETNVLNIEKNKEELNKIIKPAADYFIEKKVDSVVIGCTHFIYIEEYLKKLLSRDMTIIDSREGVGMQTARLINDIGICITSENNDNKNFFYITGDSSDLNYYTAVSDMFSLKYAGKI